MKILFVCTGNTCRSPMAELYFNKCREQLGLSACAKSAGLATQDGMPISANAFMVMQSEKIDASNFRSTQITLDMLKNEDKVYTMTASHKAMLVKAAPQFAPKISTLLPTDVSDPFGGDLQCYTTTFAMMKKQLEELAAQFD